MTKLRLFIYKNIFSCKIHKICMVLLTIFLSTPVFSQQGSTKIEGRVIDERTQEPIIGANVSLVNQKQGLYSSNDGRFSLSVQSFPVTIGVKYLGYKTQEIEIYEYSEPLVIRISEDRNVLNELVVVGYGTQKRKELTGSVATVKKEALSQLSTSFETLLGGAVPGLNVSQSSGQPGAAYNIRIRGGNSVTGGNEPLYVIDGVIIYEDAASSSTSAGVSRVSPRLNPLASLNPGDIESVEVLKDVSATAIYGSRGSNGVI
ncbi:MAG: TonB-dependent receptor plug domain-containing protein, partial [Candidatus Symbiothrix sp.]|nr:TonB-dependent receptor plug domain-containing protein [Candidatus Symbiothrix sp.]